MNFRPRAASLAFLPCFLLAASAALAASLSGSGRSVTEERAVSGYTGISLAIPAKLDVVQGTSESVSITADDNVLKEIESVVEGGVLKLRFRQRFNSVNNTRIRVTVNARAVESLVVAGSGDIHATRLDTPRLAIKVAGSGEVKLSGRAEALEVSISGSGDLDAGRLDTRRAKISVAGSGDAVVWARETLKVNVAGSGDIRYYGDPAIEKTIVGSGSVRKLGAAPT
jgi:putative autotransporter adhesin-like protein